MITPIDLASALSSRLLLIHEVRKHKRLELDNREPSKNIVTLKIDQSKTIKGSELVEMLNEYVCDGLRITRL